MKSQQKETVTPEETILIEYLQTYLPADKKLKDVMLKTSQAIADDLAEMVELTLNQIASTMIDIGYHSVIDKDGRPKWLMMNKN